MNRALRVNILTVSDRSARGEREDLSGPALADAVMALGWHVEEARVCADEAEEIRAVLTDWADAGQVDVVFTTGGTGFAARDVTPEATLAIMEKNASGLAELLRLEGMRQTPHAMLSRGVAGIRKKTILVNLPGNPKGVVEGLAVLAPLLPHAVTVLRGDDDAESGHRKTGG